MSRPRRLAARFAAVAGDQGTATAELVLLAAAVVLLTFLPVQVGVAVHARNLATAAAQDAAHAAAAADLSPGQAEAAGVAAGGRLLDGEKAITGTSIRVERGPTRVTATVTGTSMTILPGVRWQLTAVQQAPVERFVGREDTT